LKIWLLPVNFLNKLYELGTNKLYKYNSISKNNFLVFSSNCNYLLIFLSPIKFYGDYIILSNFAIGNTLSDGDGVSLELYYVIGHLKSILWKF